jgi:hypothetical protein
MDDTKFYILYKIRLRKAKRQLRAFYDGYLAKQINHTEYLKVKTAFDNLKESFDKFESDFLDDEEKKRGGEK